MLSVIKIAIILLSGSSKNFNIELAADLFNLSACLIMYTLLFPIRALVVNSF